MYVFWGSRGRRKEVAIKEKRERKRERDPKKENCKTRFRSQKSHFLQLYTPMQLSYTENNIQ